MNNRQDYNKKILTKLSKLVEKYPDLRFGQLLINYDVIKYEPSVLCDGQRENLLINDPFYEESEVTWNRMKDNSFIKWDN